MVDNATENLARAWASMDGKPFDDDGYREGYIADAAELIDRSGIAAERDALRAQLDETRAAPKVKPLVWKRQSYKNPDQIGYHASGYSIYESQETGACCVSSGAPDFFGPEHTSNLDEAKAAAQADYERRILDALE